MTSPAGLQFQDADDTMPVLSSSLFRTVHIHDDEWEKVFRDTLNAGKKDCRGRRGSLRVRAMEDVTFVCIRKGEG